MYHAPSIAGLPLAQRIAASYAPGRARAAFAALFALDARLSQALARGREPLAAQLRLAWWRELLGERAPRSADEAVEAILAALDDRASAIAMVDAWEELVADKPDLAAFAKGRAAPFVALAESRGCSASQCEDVRIAAERWALVDLAEHVSVPELRKEAQAAAKRLPLGGRLPATLRPMAVLDGLARRALARDAPLLGDRVSPLAAIRLGILGR